MSSNVNVENSSHRCVVVAWTVWSLERAQRTCGRLHVLVQTVVPGPGEGLAVKKTMESFEVEAAWRRRAT